MVKFLNNLLIYKLIKNKIFFIIYKCQYVYYVDLKMKDI